MRIFVKFDSNPAFRFRRRQTLFGRTKNGRRVETKLLVRKAGTPLVRPRAVSATGERSDFFLVGRFRREIEE